MAMETENQKNGSSPSTNDALLPDDHTDVLIDHSLTDHNPTNHSLIYHSLSNHSHAFGTVIPNRIFVGGIDYKVNEGELRHVFSQYGAVKEVKIVVDYSGMSKGYGFVTFESQEDAQKILNNPNGITLKDKKVSIGQACRRRHSSGQLKNVSTVISEVATPQHTSYGSMHLTTSTGCPYIYHNGVAYFHYPSMNPPPPQLNPPSSLMVTHSHPPVYEQPSSRQYQHGPNQYQCNAVQMPSNAVLYSQQSQYFYLPPDGGSTQPPVPLMEDSTVEFLEPTVQHVYPVYPQRAEGMTHVVVQHDPGKNQMFPSSWVHFKPRHRRHTHHTHHKNHHPLPESAAPPDASMFHAP